MTEDPNFKIKVLYSITDLPDHAIQWVEIQAGGEKLIGLTSVTLSTGVYGPTVVMAPNVLSGVIEDGKRVNSYYNGRNRTPGSNQEAMF